MLRVRTPVVTVNDVAHGGGLALPFCAAAVAALVLTACGSITVEGTLLGTAYACGSSHRVQVIVLADRAVDRTETVTSGAPFRLRLTPGHYLVEVPGASRAFEMQAGGTTHVALRPRCAR